METALRKKLYVVGGLMPPDEVGQIQESIAKISMMPREFADLLDGFNREVSAHVMACARIERSRQKAVAQYWLDHDRRK